MTTDVRQHRGILAAGISVLVALIALTALLVASRTSHTPDKATLTGRSEHYAVRVTVDPVRTGRVRTTVEVQGADEVTLEAAMPRMGHLNSELATTRSSPGRFVATGELFPMIGVWELTVRVDGPAGMELVTVVVTVKR